MHDLHGLFSSCFLHAFVAYDMPAILFNQMCKGLQMLSRLRRSLTNIIPRLCVVVCCLFVFQNKKAVSNDYLQEGESQGNGQRVFIKDIPISMKTLDGWKVIHLPKDGITLRMIGPEEAMKQGNTTLRFKPVLNVQTLQRSEPIDSIREASFKEELIKQYTIRRPLKDFQILNSKRIDFKGEQDGLVVFAKYISLGMPILQMHVLLASPHHQFSINYTDLYDLYTHDSSRSQRAWDTVFSIHFEGSAKARYASLATSLAIMVGLFILLSLLLTLKRYRQRRAMKALIRSSKRRRKPRPYSSDLISSRQVARLPKTKPYYARPPSRKKRVKEIDLGLA